MVDKQHAKRFLGLTTALESAHVESDCEQFVIGTASKLRGMLHHTNSFTLADKLQVLKSITKARVRMHPHNPKAFRVLDEISNDILHSL